MLEYVQIDGQRAEISNHTFPGYFSVDSMAVLVGPNGSGKTRLLINVAEALTTGSPIGDQGHWRGWDSQGQPIAADTRYPPTGQGVVYYTPLPYRRRITPHDQCFDASSFRGTVSRSRSYRQYQFIAQCLGIDTRLIGRLSYRKDVFRRLIVPWMLEVDCRLADPYMEDRRYELAGRQKSSWDDESHKEDLDNFAKDIESWILRLIESAGYDPLLMLSCFEHSAKSLSQRSRATHALLQALRVLAFYHARTEDEEIQNIEAIKQFDKLIYKTSSFVRDYGSQALRPVGDQGQIGYELDIDYSGAPDRFGSQVGAFEIRWENLSSGLLSLVEQFTRLELGIERLKRRGFASILLMIDEGDAYLHLDWQRQYIHHLDRFLGEVKQRLRLDCIQVLLATHSPIISGDFPSTMVQRLGTSPDDKVKIFGSPLDTLVLETFGTASIGEFAARKIKELRKRFIEHQLRPIDQALINEIGDEGLRRAVISRAKDMA